MKKVEISSKVVINFVLGDVTAERVLEVEQALNEINVVTISNGQMVGVRFHFQVSNALKASLKLDKPTEEKIKHWEIWSEGWRATGEGGDATYWGSIVAKSFQEACGLLANKNSHFKESFDKEKMQHWGCKLFDNELEARRTFG
jgi:hypothetical protein